MVEKIAESDKILRKFKFFGKKRRIFKGIG